MKKQLIHISILQSSKIMTALYVLMGFLYTLIGIPMIIFGSDQVRIIGIIYLRPRHRAFSVSSSS